MNILRIVGRSPHFAVIMIELYNTNVIQEKKNEGELDNYEWLVSLITRNLDYPLNTEK